MQTPIDNRSRWAFLGVERFTIPGLCLGARAGLFGYEVQLERTIIAHQHRNGAACVNEGTAEVGLLTVYPIAE